MAHHSLFSHDGHDTLSQIQRQVTALQRELSRRSHRAARSGAHMLDDLGDTASDLFDHALEQGRDAVQTVARGAASAGRAVQRDPVPAIVAIGTLALLATIVLARSNR